MATEVDPFELFAMLNPYAGEPISDADEQRLATIMATPLVPQPKRRRRRPWIIGGAVVVVGVATAAFAFIRRDHPDDPSGIICFPTAELSGSRSGTAYDPDPVEACRHFWTNGTFGEDGPPPLVACVPDEGLTVVVPGDESVCSNLGLANFDANTTPYQDTVSELIERASAIYPKHCYTQGESIERGQQLLDELGLDEWTVRLTEPFPPGTQCAGFGVDVPSKQVITFGLAAPNSLP